jgi:hypothetical protein
MFPHSDRRRLSALALGLTVTGFAAAACGIGATRAHTPPSADMVQAQHDQGPVRCELILDEARGSTTFQGRVTADRAVSGTYRLSITSRSAGGSAVIRQSGEFEAGPGAPALLGQTTLGGAPARHDADLELTIAGRRQSCATPRGSREL